MFVRRIAAIRIGGVRRSINQSLTQSFIRTLTPSFAPLHSRPQFEHDDNFEATISRQSVNQSGANSQKTENKAMSLDPHDHEIQPDLLQSLKTNFKITQFFPIQAECFELIVHNKDIIGQSKTGTGKTLAFVLPLIERLLRHKKATGQYKPRPGEVGILILEPTRELAVQVANEIKKLSPKTSVVTVYGGANINPQSQALLRGVDVCVATPGRLQDLLDRGVCTLRNTESVVLDEADEMLRRGFREQIERILGEKAKNVKRQMLLFSATVPSWVQDISSQYQTNPVTINTMEEGNTTPVNLVHEAMVCPSFIRDKIELIGEVVRSVKGRVILFCNSKSEADLLCSREWAEALGADAAALHGDVSQRNRDMIMADFKAGLFKLLIATDVAARGLDVPNVELVIQMGLPQDTAFYVHRSGRTARAGKHGKSVVLYRASERDQVAALGREVGVRFTFATPPRVRGRSISALTGEHGMMTIQSIDEAASPNIEDVIDSVSHVYGSPVRIDQFKKVNNGIVADLPQEVADQVLTAIEQGQKTHVPIKALTELPEELWGPKRRFEGFQRGGNGRSSGRNGQSNGRQQNRPTSYSRYSNFSNDGARSQDRHSDQNRYTERQGGRYSDRRNDDRRNDDRSSRNYGSNRW